MKTFLPLFICLFVLPSLSGQGMMLVGRVLDEGGEAVAYATVGANGGGTLADESGNFRLEVMPGTATILRVSAIGYRTHAEQITFPAGNGEDQRLTVTLQQDEATLEQVVVTGTMKAVSRSSSPVPVEVYTADYFRANPTPSVFESLQTVNGVRPQLNCAVCNTGDIHINGLEGPYTMVLIDGMPIVSGLSTVYGLTGIPQSLIARTEVVKGPAATLYGSEAVGGLINVITTRVADAPVFAADVMGSGWGELNADVGFRGRVGKRAHALTGVNYFRYQNPIDNNGDGFTDLTLQDRISVFNKWSFDRADDRQFTLAGRYVYEDRFGGQLGWDRQLHRGGDEVYGESIYTSRWETFGTYQLPLPGRVFLQFSANGHRQNSYYGTTRYAADQHVAFGQLTWNKNIGDHHDLLAGASYRFTRYDDNTTATAGFGEAAGTNAPSRIHLPGVFLQDEWRFKPRRTLLLGLRYDYNSRHGNILTPRLNYKWTLPGERDILRLSFGTGYRVANVFTEDHAALSGAREVIFADELQPETSYNGNLNYVRKIFGATGTVVTFDASTWYTYFTNRILPDYETDPNAIIYANLSGGATSRGVSLTTDVSWAGGLSLNAGLTLQDVFTQDNGQRDRQLLTETFSGVWRLSIPWLTRQIKLDYTGNVYAPMDLPLLGELDERAPRSPWFSIQNLQLTKTFANGVELYGGVKNLLNYTPPANGIARAFDPFDRNVQFDAEGQAVATPDNPQALTFDPTYVYASNQGRRLFLGVRWQLTDR